MNKSVKNSILVIDDDVGFLEMTGNLLEGLYEVSLAKSWKQALQYLSTGLAPDVILLDVAMPEMNGYETLNRIHELPGMEGTPVVFLTGMGEAEAELRGLELGAVDYITTPFVKEILLKRLEIHLKQGKELKAVYRERRGKKKPEPMTPLTPWERKIAILAQKRLTSGEIAGEMGTTDGTIRTALCTIYIKLDIHSKRDLANLDL
jgi:CheY-like chemotaxis protein/DNA-binding CsgD family transcriptional regulator